MCSFTPGGGSRESYRIEGNSSMLALSYLPEDSVLVAGGNDKKLYVFQVVGTDTQQPRLQYKV